MLFLEEMNEDEWLSDKQIQVQIKPQKLLQETETKENKIDLKRYEDEKGVPERRNHPWMNIAFHGSLHVHLMFFGYSQK